MVWKMFLSSSSEDLLHILLLLVGFYFVSFLWSSLSLRVICSVSFYCRPSFFELRNLHLLLSIEVLLQFFIFFSKDCCKFVLSAIICRVLFNRNTNIPQLIQPWLQILVYLSSFWLFKVLLLKFSLTVTKNIYRYCCQNYIWMYLDSDQKLELLEN